AQEQRVHHRARVDGAGLDDEGGSPARAGWRWRSPPRTRERRTCAVARWCRAPPSPRSSCGPRSRARPSALEHREKRLLGDLDAAHLLHALLAFLLLLEQLALARDVAAIALGGDVLAHRLHRLARDDAAADGGL